MNINIPKEDDGYDGPVHTLTTPDGKQLTLPRGAAPFVGKINLGEGPVDKTTTGKVLEKIHGIALETKAPADKEVDKKRATMGNVLHNPKPSEKFKAEAGSALNTEGAAAANADDYVDKDQTMAKLIQQRDEEERKATAPVDPVEEGQITEDTVSPLSTPIDPLYLDDIKITEEDLKEFFTKCIMEDEPYTKTYYIKAPGDMKDVPVVLRSRKASEISDIIERLSKRTDTGVSVVRIMNDYNLAASLVTIGKRVYDNIDLDLDERVHIIECMPGPKKSILWDFMSQFDLFIEKLRRAHVNF